MDAKRPGSVPTFRCSTIFVSEGEETLIYRSLSEMPTQLRKKITARTRGGASATIFIANRGGREELAKRLRGMPSRVQTRLEEAVPAEPPKKRPTEPPRFSVLPAESALPQAARQAMIVASGAALLIWLLVSWR